MWQYNFGDNSDYLEHRSHKYISRKWKNGKWRYTYYNPKKKVEDVIGISAKKEYQKLSKDNDYYADQYRKTYKTNTESQNKTLLKKVDDSGWGSIKAYKTYSKSPVGKIDSVIDKSKETASKASKKVAIGKKVVSKYLKKLLTGSTK